MTVGSIVQATGAHPYDANKLGHLGYGASPDVVTSHEFEKMLVAGEIACPSDGRTPRPNRLHPVRRFARREPPRLLLVRVLRQHDAADAEVHEIDPAIENAVIYKDIRSPGHMEYFFLAAQRRPRA